MPITKQTLAMIGSSSVIGRSIANALCRENYRLLLFEENSEEAETISDEISSSFNGADIEVLDCTHLACWKADVILILNNDRELKNLSEKIEDVSTQKIIVVLLKEEYDNEMEQIESLFPNSKVVGLYPSKRISKKIHLLTRHAKALETVRNMVSTAGFQTVEMKLKKD